MYEQFGGGLEAAVVLSVISEGIPLVYNGQEIGNRRRLAFFERDPLVWPEDGRLDPIGELYRDLFALKHATSSLHNAAWGARMVRVVNSDLSHVLSFVREDAASKVLALFNLSPDARTVTLTDGPYEGAYRAFRTHEEVHLHEGARVALEPWGWRVFVR